MASALEKQIRKLNLHQHPIFAQALPDESEENFYRVLRDGENERRQETEVIRLIETTATA